MPEEAKQKLDIRLVAAEGEPNAALLEDLVRLIRQGVVTAPTQAPQVDTAGKFVTPADSSQNALEAKIRYRIDEASKASEADVAKRAEIAKKPDSDTKLAEEALAAAQNVVAAVQRAILRGIAVRVPDVSK